MKLSTLFAIAGCLAAGPSLFGQVAAGLKLGTLGAGADVVTRIPGTAPDAFNLRVNANLLALDTDQSYSDNDYNLDFDIGSAGVLVDWFPFRGAFRVSGGLYGADEEIAIESRASSYEFGGSTYTAEQVGVLRGEAETDRSVFPYVGIGWGNPLGGEGRWRFFADIGVVFVGSPQVQLRAVGGTLANEPQLQQAIEEERREIEDDLEDISVYPVIAAGVSYRF